MDLMKYLNKKAGSEIKVHTLTGETYRGILVGFDVYVNMKMKDCRINEGDSLEWVVVNGMQVVYVDLD
ncbi:hypothetical protein ECANGB1_2044 [Enterospora canceri]|uniref:Sm domain-containing protein n=1 Tax=Enterospora canceri TaxID=1081671 RepID=A0A1Y1S558_9MICR|nr:hypothetical protein ECANGB1_2044 [Enterospora canceri]